MSGLNVPGDKIASISSSVVSVILEEIDRNGLEPTIKTLRKHAVQKPIVKSSHKTFLGLLEGLDMVTMAIKAKEGKVGISDVLKDCGKEADKIVGGESGRGIITRADSEYGKETFRKTRDAAIKVVSEATDFLVIACSEKHSGCVSAVKPYAVGNILAVISRWVCDVNKADQKGHEMFDKEDEGGGHDKMDEKYPWEE